jgi:lipoprotein-anchoring transpeptidase ErfK/SrfK
VRPVVGGRSRRAAVVLPLAAGLLGFAAVLVWPVSESAPRLAGLAASPDPALHVPAPVRLAPEPHLSMWSVVERPATARSSPGRGRRVARLRTRTPEGTDNLVVVRRRARDASGRVWVEAVLPVLPNGTTGWIPRDALGGYRRVRTHLVVNLRRLTATLERGGRRVFRARVGVGMQQWPTPRGRFYIRNKLVRYRSTFYGPLAFGTSARSAVLTDWPDGGFVGVHGTGRPELIPGRISHGCIRMRNTDIVRLGRMMPVGTPVTIQ